MDADPRPGSEYFQREISEVQLGHTVDQILHDADGRAAIRAVSAQHR
jgi:hypothetical protein